jgi:small subunit ribosomal protein S16
MVKIRLSRIGRKKDPFYRIVAISSEKKRGGAALEILGYWQPRKSLLKVDKKGIENWVKKGALISPSVQKLINSKR